jgi:triacylglycerol lipase
MWIKRLLFGTLGLFVVLLFTMIIWTQVAPEQIVTLLINAERRAAKLHAVTLQIPGFEIATLQGGEGPPLVLVHGFGADKDHFTRVAKHLVPHYRVIAIDLPGFGASSMPADEDYRIRRQTERLGQVMDALKLRSAHFGGSSMGGWIVAAFAVLYPDRVDSLWLLAPSGLVSDNESYVRRIQRETGRNLLTSATPEGFGQVIDLVFHEPPFIPGPIKRSLAERSARHHPLHMRIYDQLMEEAFWMEPQINGNPVPALVVWGNQDRVADVSGGVVYSKLLPNSELRIMSNIGHLPMIEDPKTSAADYIAFRNALPTAPEAAPGPAPGTGVQADKAARLQP